MSARLCLLLAFLALAGPGCASQQRSPLSAPGAARGEPRAKLLAWLTGRQGTHAAAGRHAAAALRQLQVTWLSGGDLEAAVRANPALWGMAAASAGLRLEVAGAGLSGERLLPPLTEGLTGILPGALALGRRVKEARELTVTARVLERRIERSAAPATHVHEYGAGERTRVEVPVTEHRLDFDLQITISVSLGGEILIRSFELGYRGKPAARSWPARPEIQLPARANTLRGDADLWRRAEQQWAPEVVKVLVEMVPPRYRAADCTGQAAADEERRAASLLAHHPAASLRDAWLSGGDAALVSLCR